MRNLKNIGKMDSVRAGRCSSEGPLERFTVLFPRNTLEKLEQAADTHGVPVATIIRAGVNRMLGLDKEKDHEC